MVRELEFKSKDPGFDPLVGQGEEQFCFSVPPESNLVQTCLCLTPPSMACTQICANVKDPMYICLKRVGITAGGMETQKHCAKGHTHKKLGSAVQWLLAFPRKAA